MMIRKGLSTTVYPVRSDVFVASSSSVLFDVGQEANYFKRLILLVFVGRLIGSEISNFRLLNHHGLASVQTSAHDRRHLVPAICKSNN